MAFGRSYGPARPLSPGVVASAGAVTSAVTPITQMLLGSPISYNRSYGATGKHGEADVWAGEVLSAGPYAGRTVFGVDDSFFTNRATELLISDAALPFSTNRTVTVANPMSQFGAQGNGSDGRNWKTNDLIEVGGVLYQSVSRHKTDETQSAPFIQTAVDCNIIKYSADLSTITPQPTTQAGFMASVMYPGSTMGTASFVHYGPSYSAAGPHNSSTYLYMVATASWNNANVLIGARRPISALPSLLNNDTEYYVGPAFTQGMSKTDADAQFALAANWSTSSTNATAIYSDTKGIGMTPIWYHADSQCYVFMNQFFTAIRNGSPTSIAQAYDSSTWQLKVSSATPFGPFVQVGADTVFADASGGYYNPRPIPSTMGVDGGKHVLWSSSGKFYPNPFQAGGTYTQFLVPGAMTKASDTPTLPATLLTLTGPSAVNVGTPASYTVTASGWTPAAISLSLSDGTVTATGTLPAGVNSTASLSYNAGSAGSKTLVLANGGGIDNSAPLTVTASAAVTPATAYTASASPTTVQSGSPTTITYTLNGSISSNVTVTPAVSGVTGTFSPTTVVFAPGDTSKTTQFTPSTAGTAALTSTNNGGLNNPASFNVTVNSVASYTNYAGSNSGGPFNQTTGPVGNWEKDNVTVTDSFGPSPRGSTSAAKLSTPTGGFKGSLQSQKTVPSTGTYNLSFWVKGLSAGQSQVLAVQENGGGYSLIAQTTFTPDTSGGGYISLDFTTPTVNLYVSIGQTSGQYAGAPSGQIGGDMLIDMAQITSGSGRKTYVPG